MLTQLLSEQAPKALKVAASTQQPDTQAKAAAAPQSGTRGEMRCKWASHHVANARSLLRGLHEALTLLRRQETRLRQRDGGPRRQRGEDACVYALQLVRSRSVLCQQRLQRGRRRSRCAWRLRPGAAATCQPAPLLPGESTKLLVLRPG